MYPKPIPWDISQDFSIFPDRIPVGFYPWSRSYLGPAYARIAEASTSFPVPPRGPGFGMTRVSAACVRPLQGGPIRCSPPHAPLEGSFHVWPWGSLDTPPRGSSHATPLGGCCVTVHDPSPAHAGGSCHPCQGVSPTTWALGDPDDMICSAGHSPRISIRGCQWSWEPRPRDLAPRPSLFNEDAEHVAESAEP